MDNLYNRICALCEKAEISITTMCRETGINRGNLSDLKMGRQTGLSAKNLDKIAEYFNVTVGYLLGRTEDPNPPKLIIPDELKEARVAFHGGADDLTQDEIDKVAEYVRFIRSQRKKED